MMELLVQFLDLAVERAHAFLAAQVIVAECDEIFSRGKLFVERLEAAVTLDDVFREDQCLVSIHRRCEQDDVGVVAFLVTAQAIERPLDAFAIVATPGFHEEIAAFELVDCFHDLPRKTWLTIYARPAWATRRGGKYLERQATFRQAERNRRGRRPALRESSQAIAAASVVNTSPEAPRFCAISTPIFSGSMMLRPRDHRDGEARARGSPPISRRAHAARKCWAARSRDSPWVFTSQIGEAE